MNGQGSRSPSGTDDIFLFQRIRISEENNHIILKNVYYACRAYDQLTMSAPSYNGQGVRGTKSLCIELTTFYFQRLYRITTLYHINFGKFKLKNIISSLKRGQSPLPKCTRDHGRMPLPMDPTLVKNPE